MTIAQVSVSLEQPLLEPAPAPDVITRARTGYREAFAELYDEYVDRVYRYLL